MFDLVFVWRVHYFIRLLTAESINPKHLTIGQKRAQEKNGYVSVQDLNDDGDSEEKRALYGYVLRDYLPYFDLVYRTLSDRLRRILGNPMKNPVKKELQMYW